MLSGSWRGGGTLYLNGGHSEKIRCTSRVSVAGAGRRANQTFRCVNPRYQVYFISSARLSGGKISGSWSDKRSGNGGGLSGRLKGRNLSLSLSSAAGSASLYISVGKCRQSINLRSYSGNFKRLSVVLRKKC